MDIKYTVYKHTFPNGKVYIGVTRRDPKIRYGKNGYQYRNNIKMWEDIQKYGWENIQHDILYKNIPLEEINTLERNLIAQYKADNPNFGYNQNKGGLFGQSTYFDEEKIVKLFKQGLGLEEITKEVGCCTKTAGEILHKNGISKEETIARGREIARQKANLTLQNRELILKLFSEHKTIMEISRIVGLERQCIDKLLKNEDITHEQIIGNSFSIHPSEINYIKEMLLSGLSRQEISAKYNCCNSAITNFVKRFLPEYYYLISLNRTKKAIKKTQKKVHQYDLNNNYIQTFDSISSAAEAVCGNRKNNAHISQVCKGKRNIAFGYKWKYAD